MQMIRMEWMRKTAVHGLAVVRGILFIGYTFQILLGLAWLGGNFTKVQDFGEPASVLYGWFFEAAGRIPQVQYVVQLSAAFAAGFVLLGAIRPAGKLLGIWRGLVLLTFPFAMQCHLALQPHSFMGTLLLLILFVLLRRSGIAPGNGRKEAEKAGSRRARLAAAAIVCGCGGLLIGLSGWADAGNLEKPGHSPAAAMASRFAWPTMLYDWEQWPEELRAVTGEVLWEASFAPGNWKLVAEAIERNGDRETAKAWYRQIAEIGWRENTQGVIGQIGWDGLGYVISPVVVPMQLEGQLYDSCTGRNYEIMRTHTPILTKLYVKYGCWWFACSICLTLILTVLSAGQIAWRSAVGGLGRCILAAGPVVWMVTMRGAGIMDYRYTIAVNQLWLIWGLLLISGKSAERKREA